MRDGADGADGVGITHSAKLNVCNFAAAMRSVESLNVMANIFGVKYNKSHDKGARVERHIRRKDAEKMEKTFTINNVLSVIHWH